MSRTDPRGGASFERPRSIWVEPVMIVIAVFLLGLTGCSDKSAPSTIVDLTPPGAIGDLTAIETSDSSVTLSWTAPPEDRDHGGPVARYDMRYRFETLDVGVWSSADTVHGEPVPAMPGEIEEFEVVGLRPDTLYAFGIVSTDDAGLSGVLSNIAFGRTRAAPIPPDTLRPAPVLDLAITYVGPSSVLLVWTASGDDSLTGRATATDVRYRIGSLSDTTWAGATQANGEPTPGPAGSGESFLLTGLRSETDYAFALRVRDEAGNVSALSNVVTARTLVRPPDFIDPRGIDVFSSGTGGQLVFVADHGDSVLYRFAVGGERVRVANVPGVWGVARGAGAGLYTFLIAGNEQRDTGSVWRFGGSSAQPAVLYQGLGFLSDIAVYPSGPFAGYLLVGEASRGRILRLKPGTPLDGQVLTTVLDGEVTGVAVDGTGTAYIGVRTAAGSSIRSLVGNGTPVLFHDLGAMGIVGDLRLDPHGDALWYLDLARSAAVRVKLSNARVDTLATGLRRPLSIAPGPADSLLTYSSADGFVWTVDRRP
jgi:hypothetical protein